MFLTPTHGEVATCFFSPSQTQWTGMNHLDTTVPSPLLLFERRFEFFKMLKVGSFLVLTSLDQIGFRWRPELM